MLDRNENHYGPAPACLAALAALAPDLLHDYSRDFQSGSYSRLSRRLAERHGVEERRVLLGYGCEDILKNAVHHFVQPGGTLLVPSASWWYYRAIAGEVGGRIREFPLTESERAYHYDADRLLAAREAGPVSLILIASPNNPTGNRITRDDLLRVLEACHDVPVVLDQAYFGFVEDEVDDWAALTALHPNLLVLRSFSKLFGLAGARIGYAVAGAEHEALLARSARNLGYNRLSESLALSALESEGYYARVRSKIVADGERVAAALRVPGRVRVYDSDANFVLARFPREIVGSLDDELRRRNLIIKFFKEPAFLDCARITIGTGEETARLLDSLSEVLSSLLAAAA